MVARDEFPGHRRMFDGMSIPGPLSQKVGYFVEVMGKTSRAAPRLYMPYPSKLTLVESSPTGIGDEHESARHN
jgi:hypothetical protein